MKKKYLILLIFTQFIYSQNINGIVLDSISKTPIELANIFFTENYYGTFSNQEGKFELNPKDSKSDLLITAIGYESKKISLSAYKNIKDSLMIFYLKPKLEQLAEIVLTDKKIKYTSSKNILSERENFLFYSFKFGNESVAYIKNDLYKKGKIESVFLDLQKVKNYKKPCKKCKVEYLVSLNIKFYEYDKKNKKPGNEIHHKNIIVEPENKTYKLRIDLDSLNIDFPKDGVCVGVETINAKYSNINKSFALIAPSIKYTNTKKKSEVLSWFRNRNEKWIFKTDSNRGSNNKFFKSIVVDLKVKIEK